MTDATADSRRLAAAVYRGEHDRVDKILREIRKRRVVSNPFNSEREAQAYEKLKSKGYLKHVS